MLITQAAGLQNQLQNQKGVQKKNEGTKSRLARLDPTTKNEGQDIQMMRQP